MNEHTIYLGIAFGIFVGILIISVLRANDESPGDDARRLDFMQGESIFISRAEDFIVVYGADHNQLSISTDLRTALDKAAAKLLNAADRG
jgi:hypothetical protein